MQFCTNTCCLMNSKDQTKGVAPEESLGKLEVSTAFAKFVTFRLIELYPDCSTDEKQ